MLYDPCQHTTKSSRFDVGWGFRLLIICLRNPKLKENDPSTTPYVEEYVSFFGGGVLQQLVVLGGSGYFVTEYNCTYNCT